MCPHASLQYLTNEEIKNTVRAVCSVSAPGSHLMCELFDTHLMTDAGKQDPLLAPYWKAVSGCGEPYRGLQLAPAAMPAFWKENGCKVVRHSTPEEQLERWKTVPGSQTIDASGTLPHGGICHLWLLQTK